MVDAVESAPSQPAIEARGMTKHFGVNVAVNDVSFEVNKGEVLGFLGPNGSGKTTTMRLITSYCTPDSGTILVDGLAQAILHQPDILIFDEPTEGLDPNQRVLIQELIVSIGRHRTVMLSTHVLPEAERICDRVMIISWGRIVVQGTISELRAEVKRSSTIQLEVEGEGVEEALGELSHISSIERRLARGARLGFTIVRTRSLVSESDVTVIPGVGSIIRGGWSG